jgi:oligo-1,6-glucosidase
VPWIKVNPNYQHINVERALADPDSIFHYYRRLIELRKAHPVFVYGTYDLLLANDPEIYAYTRNWEDHRLLVILNFSANGPTFALPAHVTASKSELLISNYAIADEALQLQHITLRPYEARVYILN